MVAPRRQRREMRFVGPRGAVAGPLRGRNAVSRDRHRQPRCRRPQAGGAPQPRAGHQRRPRALLRPRLRFRCDARRGVEQHRRQHHVPRVAGPGQLPRHLHGHRERPVADRQASSAAATATTAAAAVLRPGAAAVVPRKPGQWRLRRCADAAAAATAAGGAAGAVDGQPAAQAAARVPQLRQRRLAAAGAVRPAVEQVLVAGPAGVRRGGGGPFQPGAQAGAADVGRRRGGGRRRRCRLRRRRPAVAGGGAGQRRRPTAATVAVLLAAGAARRVQPVHQQGPRDPVAGVPAVERAAQAGARETAQVPQPAEQDAGARAAVRVPRRELRPALLALRRAHQAHPHPHGPEAVPVPHLHAILLAVRPPHDAHPHAHGGEALQLRRLRTQVRALRREEAPRQGAPQAAHEEGEQAGDEHVVAAAAAAATAAAATATAAAAPPPPPVAPPSRPPARPPPARTRPRLHEQHAGGRPHGAAGDDVALSPTHRRRRRVTTTTATTTTTSRRRSRGRGRDRLRTRTRIRNRSRNRRRPRTGGGSRRPPVAGSHRKPRPSSRLFVLCVRHTPFLRLRQPLVGVQVQEHHPLRSRRGHGGRRQQKRARGRERSRRHLKNPNCLPPTPCNPQTSVGTTQTLYRAKCSSGLRYSGYSVCNEPLRFFSSILKEKNISMLL